MVPFVRSCALSDYDTLVTELGGDSNSLLRSEHIEPALLRKEDNLVRFPSFAGLLNTSARALNCPDFGLRLSEKQGFKVLGAVALVGLNSPTVEEALTSMLEVLGFHTSVVTSSLDTATDRRHPRITLDVEATGRQNVAQVYEAGIGNIVQELKILTGGRFAPSGIQFRHRPISAPDFYQQYFQTRVTFEQEVNAVVVTPEILKLRIDNADTQIRELALKYVGRTNDIPTDIVTQVKATLPGYLPSGNFRIRDIANRLCMHERTLQRRLRDEGFSFDMLVDGVRSERAEELLRHTRLPMLQVAWALGYREQSSLNHACLRWFGATPSELRYADPSQVALTLN